MNKIITIAITVICMAFALQANADNKKDNIYAFGFSASFNDSTVYFTDIQPMPEATIERKTHFLQNRDAYSVQLKDFLANQGAPHRVCAVIYATKQKDIEKKFTKLRKKYIKTGKFDIKYLAANEFKFTPLPAEEQTETAPMTKEAKKKAKIQAKEAKKKAKDAKKQAKVAKKEAKKTKKTTPEA